MSQTQSGLTRVRPKFGAIDEKRYFVSCCFAPFVVRTPFDATIGSGHEICDTISNQDMDVSVNQTHICITQF